jgi:inosine-uridine nucleoside N-ribohydrolase
MREKSVTELDKYIIIDTHGGEEDIFGIVAAIQLAKKYDKTILGITCVAGRNTVERAVEHALIAQQITGTRIPVYKGNQYMTKELTIVCCSTRTTPNATISLTILLRSQL